MSIFGTGRVILGLLAAWLLLLGCGKESRSSATSLQGANSPTATVGAQEAPKSIVVHVTRTGRKYHSAGCQYLSRSDFAVSLDEAKARGLTPCSRCYPPQ